MNVRQMQPQSPGSIRVTQKMMELSSPIQCPECKMNVWLPAVSLRKVSHLAVPELPSDVLLNTPRYVCSGCGAVIDGLGNQVFETPALND